MKNILKSLEESKFISNIHTTALWADAFNFAKLIKKNPKAINMLKSYKEDAIVTGALRVKFNLMTSGFHEYLGVLIDNSNDELMLSCNMPDGLLLVAYKGSENTNNVINYLFSYCKSIPIDRDIINLDFDNKVHILLYDLRLAFPGFSVN